MAETNNKLSGLNFASAAKVTMKLNHVTFQDSPDTSTSIKVTSQDSPDASVYISMKETEIPISDRDNPRPTARKSSIISISEMKLTYHRLAFAFGICCIVMLFMLPIIFYYVDGNSDVSDIPPSRAIGIVNISQVHIYACMYAYKYVVSRSQTAILSPLFHYDVIGRQNRVW